MLGGILIRCYYRKYFRHHFLIIIIKRKERNLLAGGVPETHTLRKHVVVEYLNVWFWLTTPINQKRSTRNLFFFLSSKSFASFLWQTSDLVHSSLHLSTWPPRFTCHDLCLSCRSSKTFFLFWSSEDKW